MHYVRYTEYSRIRQKFTRQLDLGTFIRRQFSDDSHDYDQRSDMQIKLDGSCELLLALVEKLLDKGLLSMQDIEEMLPNKNYTEILGVSQEWDHTLH